MKSVLLLALLLLVILSGCMSVPAYKAFIEQEPKTPRTEYSRHGNPAGQSATSGPSFGLDGSNSNYGSRSEPEGTDDGSNNRDL